MLYFGLMTKNETVYESAFHRQYVAGQGEVGEPVSREPEIRPPFQTAYERALAWYRLYVGDPSAELPEEVAEQLKKYGKV